MTNLSEVGRLLGDCPQCQSQDTKRYGRNSAGNQRYVCKACGVEFVAAILSIKRSGKSGVFPVPVREREFRPLKRDPFEHWRLAETVKR